MTVNIKGTLVFRFSFLPQRAPLHSRNIQIIHPDNKSSFTTNCTDRVAVMRLLTTARIIDSQYSGEMPRTSLS